MSRKSSINKIKRSNAMSKNIDSLLSMWLYEKGHSPITNHVKQISGLGECDVISISKSDYIYEYEVKISRSDFKADFKKEKHQLMLEGKGTKERLIKENNTIDTWYLTPNYFYFVVPRDLISIEEVPEYAGLMYMDENLQFEIIKKSPLIHKTKATNNFIRQLSHNLTCKLVFKKID
jgi:hypothetical protein